MIRHSLTSNECLHEERGISLFVPGVIYSNNKGEIYDFQDLNISCHFMEDFLAPPSLKHTNPPLLERQTARAKMQFLRCSMIQPLLSEELEYLEEYNKLVPRS